MEELVTLQKKSVLGFLLVSFVYFKMTYESIHLYIRYRYEKAVKLNSEGIILRNTRRISSMLRVSEYLKV